jgi:hypothetical protein
VRGDPPPAFVGGAAAAAAAARPSLPRAATPSYVVGSSPTCGRTSLAGQSARRAGLSWSDSTGTMHYFARRFAVFAPRRATTSRPRGPTQTQRRTYALAWRDSWAAGGAHRCLPSLFPRSSLSSCCSTDGRLRASLRGEIPMAMAPMHMRAPRALSVNRHVIVQVRRHLLSAPSLRRD